MVAFKVAFISVFVALIYVLSPCMIISSFFSMEFSWAALRDMGLFFLVSFAVAFVLPVPYAFKASLFILGSVILSGSIILA